MVDRSDARAAPERHLGVFDAVCAVVGIVVGSLIFFLGPYLVAQNTTSPATMLLAWVFGGFLCLCGALSYAAYVAGEVRNPRRNMLRFSWSASRSSPFSTWPSTWLTFAPWASAG